MSIRAADKAGIWYSDDRKELKAEVEDCLAKAASLRPGDPKGKPLAIVVPHAGLAFSGPIAAAAFAWLHRARVKIDSFVVFGACHHSTPQVPAIWARGAWDNPLGPAEIDAELAGLLITAGVGEANERPHSGDNAIELQLPFIRFLFPEARLVPVAVPFLSDAHRYGELAARTAEKSGKATIAVASTDLTHYGAAFGLMPAGTGKPALAWTRENDRRFLETLLRLDFCAIVPTAERDGSACGAGAAAAAAGWAGTLGAKEGWLLARTDSFEAMPSGRADHIVGYAAVAYASPVETDRVSG
ncbi:MAG: AmmeMemoRadiSam system protein B [Planctomycetota bacterium]|jgi:AmmeMemoRadiSam system protein B|nr:AmmeMemoRadiSam system protein B [Planctomycetota bacterium]